MPRLYLVRHGKAAASWAEEADPGLDETGHAQAEKTCAALSKLPTMALCASPLRRARETAAPLERAWNRVARVEPAVAEIPSAGMAVLKRGPWLRAVMAGRWSDQTPSLQDWRRAVIDCLIALPGDTVIFSHFVAINVAMGAALEDDRVTVFAPDNASVSIFSTEAGRLTLIEKGREGATVVR